MTDYKLVTCVKKKTRKKKQLKCNQISKKSNIHALMWKKNTKKIVCNALSTKYQEYD
jgi:hypothetical protein